jgi:hypothetical protein
MDPERRHVPEHMKEFAFVTLARAIYECTFADIGAPYGHALAVGHAAHGAELMIKARIAQEHPLLIFDTLPKSANADDLLTAKELFETGRTLQYSELPEALWATTGIRMANVLRFQEFGRYRNMILHFTLPPDKEWSNETLSYVFEVIEPLAQCVGKTRRKRFSCLLVYGIR